MQRLQKIYYIQSSHLLGKPSQHGHISIKKSSTDPEDTKLQSDLKIAS